MNPTDSILSNDERQLFISNPCSGCLRCKPSLADEYRLSEEKQVQRRTYFSRFYRSNRSETVKTNETKSTEPVENAECGLEFTVDLEKYPIQIWVQPDNESKTIRYEFSDQFERFNYNKETYPRSSRSVAHLRLNLNKNLIEKHLLINHDKVEWKAEDSISCRIEFSEKSLKFLQINPEKLLDRSGNGKPTSNELDEEILEKKGIFLFPSSSKHSKRQIA